MQMSRRLQSIRLIMMTLLKLKVECKQNQDTDATDTVEVGVIITMGVNLVKEKAAKDIRVVKDIKEIKVAKAEGITTMGTPTKAVATIITTRRQKLNQVTFGIWTLTAVVFEMKSRTYVKREHLCAEC